MSHPSTDDSRARPRLTVVRGPFANPAELRAFQLMSGAIDVRVVRSSRRIEAPPLEFFRAPCAATLLDRIPKLRRLYRALLTSVLGDPHYLVGLPHRLAGADIVDVPETFNFLSYQAARYCERSGVPLVVSVCENVFYQRETNPRARRLKRFVRGAGRAFVARTAQIGETLLAEGVEASRVRVISTGVDTALFRPGPRDPEFLSRLGLSPSDVIILFAGKLVWEKGVSDLIRVFKSLPVRAPLFERNLKLLIVGSGKESRKLRHLARDLEIAGRVVFAGALAFDRMPILYNCADIAVVPSKPYWDGAEQEARVIREAMACGRPVIVTQCGGSVDVLGDAGIVVPPADHPAMAEALRSLLADAGLRARLGERARRRARSVLDSGRAAAQLESLYLELLQESRGSNGAPAVLARPEKQP